MQTLLLLRDDICAKVPHNATRKDFCMVNWWITSGFREDVFKGLKNNTNTNTNNNNNID